MDIFNPNVSVNVTFLQLQQEEAFNYLDLKKSAYASTNSYDTSNHNAWDIIFPDAKQILGVKKKKKINSKG